MYRLLFFGLCITLQFPYLSDALRVGSFNLEPFELSKIKDGNVMSSIVKILRRYDVVLIMGIRDKDVIPKLLNKLNASGAQWNVKSSKRVGPAGDKEQYAFYYKVKYLTAGRIYQFDDGKADGNDTFVRAPFGTLFNSSNTGDLKQFGLLGVRVYKEAAVAENNALSDVLDKAMTSWNVSDVMLLGDLKADCNHVKAEELANLTLKQDDSYLWLIGDEVDTTLPDATDCAYDRIIVHGMLLKSETDAATAKAYRFDEELGLSTPAAKRIGRHYPVEVEVVIHSVGDDEIEGSAAVASTTVAGTAVVGTTVTGTTVAGSTVAGTTVTGTTVVGTAVAGTTVAGTTVAGITVTGTTVAGTTVDGTTVVGTTVIGTTVADNTVNGDDEVNGRNENSKNGLKISKVIGGSEEKVNDDNRNKAARNTGFSISGCIIFLLRYFVI